MIRLHRCDGLDTDVYTGMFIGNSTLVCVGSEILTISHTVLTFVDYLALVCMYACESCLSCYSFVGIDLICVYT